jgi:hypothetical protein
MQARKAVKAFVRSMLDHPANRAPISRAHRWNAGMLQGNMCREVQWFA